MGRSVLVRLRADISDYSAKMKAAGRETSAAIDKNAESIDAVSNRLGLLGVGLTAFAAVAVRKFADFDQAMSNVQAATHETVQNMDLLRQAAIDAGAETVFSATEAAGAIEALSKAGVSTTDILGGGLTGALDLAAAGNLDVAQAAEIAATTMVQFGKSGKDVTHISDLLAAGAGKAQGEVTDMALALKYAGVPLAQLGVSMEQTAGTIALFAKNGIVGEQAGTSLRSMIASLTSPSTQAANTMDDLGISVFDASGKFIGLDGVAGQLHSRLGQLTDAERANALGRIFGNESLQAANVLTSQGAQAVREWTAAVDDQGYAAETAATRLDNLKGDWEGFTGSLDTALIGMSEGANGPLRSLVQQATDVVNAFSGLPDGVQQATLAIVGGAGLVTLGAAGLGKLVVGANDVIVSLRKMNISAKTAGIAVGGVGAALTIATVAVTAWASAQAEAKARTEEYAATLDDFGARTDETLSKVNEALSKDRNGFLENLFGRDPDSLIDKAEKFGLAIEDLQGYILGQADAVDRVNLAVEKYNDQFSGMEYRSAQEESRGFTSALDAEAESLTNAEKTSGQKALADRATTESTKALAAATGDTTEAVEDQTDAVKELVAGQSDLAGVVLSLRDAQRGLEAAYDDATESIKDNGQTLDITTEAGRANQQALDDIASAGWDLVESMQANGASQADMQASLQGTRDRFIEVAQKMGLSSDEAVALADSLNLIPAKVDTTVNADVWGAQAAIDRFITSNTGRKIAVKIDAQGTATYRVAGSSVSWNENGGLLAFANGGGIDSSGRSVPRVPQIAEGGRNIMWAEPATGWEAYISGKPSMRNRNIDIWQQAGKRLGVTAFADGGGMYAQRSGWATPAAAATPSLAGLEIVGTLDTPFGPAQVRGVVRSELAEQERSIRAGVR